MKIARVLLLWMLLTALTLSCALADGVGCAARPMDAARFAHYPSFTLEEERWSVNAVEADGLLDRFWYTGSRMQIEMCVFHVALEGNAATGVWTPVLRFYYIDGAAPINARAVSLLADGVRYDLAASSQRVSLGRATAEMITAPLTREAAGAIATLAGAQAMSVRLLGDEIYTAELRPDLLNERGLIEYSSLRGLESGAALLQEAMISGYGLWDLSADAWEHEHGYRPAYACSAVETTLQGQTIHDPFGMVMIGDRSAAAPEAQALLLGSGFLNEKPADVFSQSASDAARRAQRYLGLIETGCLDASLAQALSAGPRQEEPVLPALQPLGSCAAVALERYWFARAVSASASPQARRSVLNTDNYLLAADGLIRSLSARQMHLFMQVQASVVYNGEVPFEAAVVCQCNQGTGLDTLLLPMAQARLIVYAEVPAYLAQDPAAEWSIQLTADGQTLEFDLQ